jgi:predicted O-methyltransferase YrrM
MSEFDNENWRLKLAGTPLLGPILLGMLRAKIGLGYLFFQKKLVLSWLFRDRETSNYTYPLVPLNERYLVSFLAQITGHPHKEISEYIQELKDDEQLASHIRDLTARHPRRVISNKSVNYCKRLGWYALVRTVKPSLVIETGVDKGLGSCVLSAALIRNRAEGFSGKYIGTDINPKAGLLYRPPYSEMGEILYGDSIESLTKLQAPVDLFINDSDHSVEYEAREYRVIDSKLSPKAVIVGDNSRGSSSLLDFAEETGRSFLFWSEQPAEHWYQGAGMGVAFTRLDR